ncbi:MAG TPA: carbohydrate binding family 9 domain-containing protein, partial [Candidatus Elarobacter sp.]|nr:carbohydrate binding family 9 domain-containing protein [Candidatus Elarobacter sp.]
MSLTKYPAIAALGAWLLVPGIGGAQHTTQTSSVHPNAPPTAEASRRTSAIVIDGKLDDAAWSAARPITEFREYQPTEGGPATQRTEVRILYDDQALYIGARMYDSLGAAGVRAPLARRDQLLDANGNNGSFNSLTTDKIVVILDPYHNHIDRALFEINPAGVRGDQLNGDDSWDPIWEATAHVDSLGWTAEMRIPYSQLRFSRDSAQTWGMQIWRYADRLNERDMWSYWRHNESGGPAFFGHLTGITVNERPKQIELLPYVVSRDQFKYAAPTDPYH